MRTTVKFLLSALLIFTSINTLFSQRLFQPIKSISLVATPVLLDRQNSIQDLEVIPIDYPDTLIINEVAQFTGYIKNTSELVFNAAINLNFDLNQLENIDLENVENYLPADADEVSLLPQISLQPGDSVLFSNSVYINPQVIDPNSTGVVIIWPEFRLMPNQNEVEANYSIGQFYATGLTLGNHNFGPGKINNNNASALKINSSDINSYTKLQNYLNQNNHTSANFLLSTIDGKIILQQNNIPQLKIINNVLQQSNSKVAILNVIVENLVAKQEMITLKLQNNTF